MNNKLSVIIKNVTTAMIISLLAITVLANNQTGEDDQGNPNDPGINERANACFEYGTMENSCNTTDINENGSVEDWEVEWMWTCGWYKIRAEYGIIPLEQLPAGCELETGKDSTEPVEVFPPWVDPPI